MGMTTWRPIESAPSGDWFLITDEKNTVIAQHGPISGWCHWQNGERVDFVPTHWLPLSAPPPVWTPTDEQGRLEMALEGALSAMKAASVYVLSRERIKQREGDEWWAAQIAKVEAALNPLSKGDADEG
jgi:hypothetical protein